jgi:hypothetical protein
MILCNSKEGKSIIKDLYTKLGTNPSFRNPAAAVGVVLELSKSAV